MELDSELYLRVGIGLAVFAPLALWEVLAPRRAATVGRVPRWPSNIAIVVLDTLLVRVLIPVAAVAVAVIAAQRGWGLLNITRWPPLLEGVIGFLVLDLVIYGQHVAFHKVPWLWRLHRMHHADLDIDVTTGLRFHPIEILLSMLLKMAVVVLVGVPATAVIVFEVVLNATSMFNHANRRDAGVARPHRAPHGRDARHAPRASFGARHETDSNFGFNLPWWDRLFRTYRAAPQAGHDGMTIGLPVFRDPKELRLDRLLEPAVPRRQVRPIEIRSRRVRAAHRFATRDAKPLRRANGGIG